MGNCSCKRGQQHLETDSSDSARSRNNYDFTISKSLSNYNIPNLCGAGFEIGSCKWWRSICASDGIIHGPGAAKMADAIADLVENELKGAGFFQWMNSIFRANTFIYGTGIPYFTSRADKLNPLDQLGKLSVISEPGVDNHLDLRYITKILKNIYATRDYYLTQGSSVDDPSILLSNGSFAAGNEEMKIIEEVPVGSKELRFIDHDMPETNDAQKLEKIWSEMYKSNDEKYTKNVAIKLKLDISLDDFFNQFLSDDASVSLESLHKAEGDSDVKTTKWKSKTVDGLKVEKRTITYKHTIHSPIPKAPSFGAATKNQTMHRFGDIGVYLYSETWINDVPLADCFYVADRFVVAANPEGGISLTIQFGNCFVKRTMFKKIINVASANEVSEFHKAYLESIRRTIENKPETR